MQETTPEPVFLPEEHEPEFHVSLANLQEEVDESLLSDTPESLMQRLDEGDGLSVVLMFAMNLGDHDQERLEDALTSRYSGMAPPDKLEAIHQVAWYEWHSIFPRLMDQFYLDSNPVVRATAARSAPSFHPHCSRLLDDPEPTVRAAACQQVFFGFGSGWKPYVDKMMRDPSPEVRQALAKNRVIPYFFPIEFRMLKDDRDPRIRMALAENPAVARLYPDSLLSR